MPNEDVQIAKVKELDLEMIEPSTRNYMDPEQGGHKVVVIGKPGCFEKGTEIMMYNGEIKKVEDVVPGDRVMGWDSKPRNVLELCRNTDEMYEICYGVNKDKVVVNKKHILTLQDKETDKVIDIPLDQFLNKDEKFQQRYKWFRVGVEFPDRKLPEEPSLIGSKWTTSIPSEYKTSSSRQRLSLINAYFNRYGERNGSICSVKKGEVLIDDIIHVAQTLGMYAVEKPDEYVFKKNFGMSFTITYLKHDQYYGFTTDGDHRFLLSDCSVVHNTGKTTLISSLLYAKKHIIPVGQVYSGTEDSNGFYRRIFPSTFVFNKYDTEQIERFISRQKIAKKHLENPWAVLLIDDCTDKPAEFRRPLQNGLYKRGRHWKMLYILSLQYCMDVPPVIRTNVDGCFILREVNLKNRRSLYENYAGVIPSFKLFCQIMDGITDDYTALYIHNAIQVNDWRECIYYYKAPKSVPENFQFGSDEFWEFHLARYNPEYVDPLF